MFDAITDETQRGGVRGFFARHFGPVTHPDVAEDEIRGVATAFSVLAGLSALLGVVTGTSATVIAGVVFAVLALTLRFVRSRVAAVVLLALTTLNAIAALPRVLAFAWVAFAARATQLTFGYHRLASASGSLPGSATAPPPLPVPPPPPPPQAPPPGAMPPGT